ncbi:MAG: lmo0937 family membrane protein [Bacteroidales bacterium]|nr:lmo0937 family membrane protein [Bacteroidales bacterium]
MIKAEWIYAGAVVLLVIWIIGFFMYNAGYVIHLLLIIAIMAIVLRLIRTREE